MASIFPGGPDVVSSAMPQADGRDAGPVPSLAEAVQAPLLKLIEDYTAAMETMRRALAALGPLVAVSGAGSPAQPSPTAFQPAAPPVSPIGVEVSGGDRQALVDFEDALSQITGVERVALKNFGDGHAAFAVTLAGVGGASEAGPGFSVVCAWCGRLLTLGGVRISHGLCPDCAAAASAGRAVRDIPAMSENHDDKMLMFLKRSPKGWVARRSNGAGGWIELKTGCPADMPAHLVLDQVAAEYPDMLVVISGEAGAVATNRARAKSAIG